MRASICASIAAAALTATAALAQQSPQTAPGQPMRGPMMNQGTMGRDMMMDRGMMPMMGMMNPAEHIEGRLAFLKTELKITDTQMPQWDAFADALRSSAKRMGDVMAAGHGTMMEMMSGQAATPSLPSRLERAEAHMSAHLEMLRAMKGPTTQLYAVLSDDQKRMADRLIHGPMGMMMVM